MPKVQVDFSSSLSLDDRDLIENYRGQDSTLGEIARSAYERRHLTSRQREVLQHPYRSNFELPRSMQHHEFQYDDSIHWDDPMEDWIRGDDWGSH